MGFSFSPKSVQTPTSPATPSSKKTPSKLQMDEDDVDIVNPKNFAEAYPKGNPLASPSNNTEFRRNQDRINRMLTKLASEGENLAPSWAAPLITKSVPVIMAIMYYVMLAYPYAVKAYDFCLKLNETLPMDLLVAVWGIVLCFFGGTFPLSIAAYEAFKISGWDQTRCALGDLKSEYNTYRRASVVDDKKDDDNNGVADVDEIGDPKALVKRKMNLAFRVCDPQKFEVAVGGIYQGFIGVIATLKFKYARTVALGVSIGSALRKPVSIWATPVLAKVVATEHHKWIPYGINYACKLVAVSIAWYVQSIISSVQCAIRGGLLFSRGILRFLNKKGVIKLDEDETYLDEILGWTFAFFGASFQIFRGFSLPFPLNILLIPFRILEAWLQWIVTSK